MYYWDIPLQGDMIPILSDSPQEAKERLMIMLRTLYNFKGGWQDIIWRGDYNLGYVRYAHDWQ